MVHYSLSFLVSLAYSCDEVQSIMCLSPNFQPWLKRLTLEAPEVLQCVHGLKSKTIFIDCQNHTLFWQIIKKIYMKSLWLFTIGQYLGNTLIIYFVCLSHNIYHVLWIFSFFNFLVSVMIHGVCDIHCDVAWHFVAISYSFLSVFFLHLIALNKPRKQI